MPLNVRSLATTFAIIVFFITAGIGAFYKHSPFTSCKRALLALLISYVAMTLIVRMINAMVLDAMITKQVNSRLSKKAK